MMGGPVDIDPIEVILVNPKDILCALLLRHVKSLKTNKLTGGYNEQK